MSKINGLILTEGPSKFDGKPIAFIATGLDKASSNPKTGSAIQTYCIRTDIHPSESRKNGLDKSMCNECPHSSAKAKSCYVLDLPLIGIKKKYDQGGYPRYDKNIHLDLFKDKVVRWGSFGEPVLIDLKLMEEISSVASSTLGYSHTWKDPRFQEYRKFCMASADNLQEAELAKSMGWRPFYVRQKTDPLPKGYFECPASKEMGNKLTCVECRACSGGELKNKRIPTPSIVLHGVKATNYTKYIQKQAILTINGK